MFPRPARQPGRVFGSDRTHQSGITRAFGALSASGRKWAAQGEWASWPAGRTGLFRGPPSLGSLAKGPLQTFIHHLVLRTGDKTDTELVSVMGADVPPPGPHSDRDWR